MSLQLYRSIKEIDVDNFSGCVQYSHVSMQLLPHTGNIYDQCFVGLL